jgi:transposase
MFLDTGKKVAVITFIASSNVKDIPPPRIQNKTKKRKRKKKKKKKKKKKRKKKERQKPRVNSVKCKMEALYP